MSRSARVLVSIATVLGALHAAVAGAEDAMPAIAAAAGGTEPADAAPAPSPASAISEGATSDGATSDGATSDGATSDGTTSSPAREASGASYHWDRGRARFAVSTRLDAGAIARVQVHVGYGKPFWTWVGLEAHALSTTEFGALYLGVRASTPVLEASAGIRFDATYRRGPLPRVARYDDADLEASIPASTYRAIDLDLYGVVPAGRLLMPIEFAATHLMAAGVRYEEWHRVVVTGAWVLAVRVAPLAVVDRGRRHRLGVLGEWLFDTGRDASTFRIGPAYQFAITPSVDVYVVGSLPLVSPDALSAWNDLYGTATIRYRWASGDVAPPRLRGR